jgi:hypothetical protein
MALANGKGGPTSQRAPQEIEERSAATSYQHYYQPVSYQHAPCCTMHGRRLAANNKALGK